MEQDQENPLINLANIFRNPSVKQATDKIMDTIADASVSFATSTFLRDFLLGYVLSYLNSGVCPSCLQKIGEATEVDYFQRCPLCGAVCDQDNPIIMVDPLRMKLAIDNNANLFEIFPEHIKMPDQAEGIIDQHGPLILDLWDRVPTELFFEPLVAWIQDKRPDLYYTIALYDNPNTPYFAQVLFEIEMKKLPEDRKQEFCQEVGLDENMDNEQLHGVIVEGMEKNLESRVRYYVMNGTEIVEKFKSEEEAKEYVKSNGSNLDYFRMEGVNGYALKTFFHQIDTLKNGLRDMIAQQVDGGG